MPVSGKARAGRAPSGAGSCLQKLALAWACLLVTALLYLNKAMMPEGTDESGHHPEPDPEGKFMNIMQKLHEKEQAGVANLAEKVRHYEELVSNVRKDHGGLAQSLRGGRAEAPSKPGADVPEIATLTDFDNNSPRPPPKEGEYEVMTEAPDILPGADENHQHGILGLLPDGTPRMPPTPLPPGGLTTEERRDAHRGFCFNSRKSDSLSLDRDQPDVRNGACKRKHSKYPWDLPIASVVIVFHNENLSVLLRSIHTVLNHSPPRLLREIILCDDASQPDEARFYKRHWDRLQDELTEYIKHLPKLRLVRLKERRGLMLARMEGVWRSKSEVTVFLDSHIEATAGWLEPLLARIHEDKNHVVVPSIDSIGMEDFSFRGAGGLGVLEFSWTLGQVPKGADTGSDGAQPAKSPVMAGGLFASDTREFLKLGGYDPEMRLYGGEEMEIGFRTWMCGGDIEYVPCSHVGHVFRSGAYWQGQVYRVPGEEIARNKLRTAEVWMDEYKDLVKFATAPLPNTLPIGDMEPRFQLRRKLQCQDFGWYLKNVVPTMFVPKISSEAKGGALRNPGLNACVDTLGHSNPGAPMGAYPCHGQHGTQALVLDGDGHVRLPMSGYKACMGDSGQKSPSIVHCQEGEDSQRWKWDASTEHFHLPSEGKCLFASREQSEGSPFSLQLVPCSEGDPSQKWGWMG